MLTDTLTTRFGETDLSIESIKAVLAAFIFALAAAVSPASLAQATADGDKDGIADSVDDCPYTPVGAKVDRTGCALDEDFDGVADGLDRCISTPLGAVVDADGCTKEQIASSAPAPVPAPVPPPIIVPEPYVAPAPPATGIDPFSTRPYEPPGAQIQAYPLGEAPTPGQISRGEVSVPPMRAYPTVPDQVRADLDARSSGKTVINVPVLRDPSQPPAIPLPVETVTAPTPQFDATPQPAAPPAGSAGQFTPAPAPPPRAPEPSATASLAPGQEPAVVVEKAVDKTLITLPVLRDPTQPPSTPLPIERVPTPVPQFDATPQPAAPPVSEVTQFTPAPTPAKPIEVPPPAPAPPPAVEVRQAYLGQRPIVTTTPRLSTTSVAPAAPRAVIPPTTSSFVPTPTPSFDGVAPVDPLSTPAVTTSGKTDWSLSLGGAGDISGAAQQTLREAAEVIKQAQRENPTLNYEVAGSVNAASNAISYLASQGVAISRLRLKATSATDGSVTIRPASE